MSTFSNPVSAATHVDLLNMVRSSVIVLGDVEDEDIVAVLNQKVLPRIRMALVGSKNANSSDEGINVFLGVSRTLADLATASVQTEIDTKLDALISGSMMQEQVFQVAANMAAGYLTVSRVGIVEQFYKTGMDLISRADKDLENLTNGPLFKAAVTALIDSTASSTDTAANIYISHAIDTETAGSYDATARTIKTWPGAQESGIAKLWVGTVSFQTSVAIGDTATTILYNLIKAYRTAQLTREAAGQTLMNVAFGVNEGPLVSVVASVPQPTLVNPTALAQAQALAKLGYLSVHALNYDNTVDAQMVTLELGTMPGTEFIPGIKGLVYGVEGSYSQLTPVGPHSVLIDIKTGKTTAVTSTTVKGSVTDTFYFRVQPDPGVAVLPVSGTLAANETVTLTILGKTCVITAPATGYTAAEVVTAFVNALAQPQTLITLGGLMLTASAVLVPAGTSSLVLNWYDAASTGKTAALSTTSTTLSVSTSATFAGYAATNTLKTAGQFRYRSGNLYSATATSQDMIRTVTVPAGTEIMTALGLLCDSIYGSQDSLHLLAALRSPVSITPSGTPSQILAEPSIQFVPFLMETVDARIVFDLLEVPPELLFADKPLEQLPSPVYFDSKAKSLVLEPVTLKRTASTTEDTSSSSSQLGARYARPAETPLQAKLRQFNGRKSFGFEL